MPSIGIVYNNEITQHVLPCFFEKKKKKKFSTCYLVMLLTCVVVSRYVVFLRILGPQLLMPVNLYKYLQDYRRPFSSFKLNEGWPYIPLPCYNESEK